MDFKTKYKLAKVLNGKLHYKTIYYQIVKYPFRIFVLPFDFMHSLIKLAIKHLKIFYNKLIINYKYAIFCKKNKGKKVSDFVQLLALYLPQYHVIPENNQWWGEGFTEWTNVKKAKPLFTGHYQPHVPHSDVGYYDLADVNVMRKQAQMAKDYGIGGFVFYYYHFANGKRLLETPINNYVQAKNIDFPFCFAWANESWTRVWDGGEKNIIMPQDYDEENIINMIENMIEAFSDSRYIKIDNKPLLLVYRAEVVPEIEKITQKWRKKITAAGFDGLYLISMQNFKRENPYKMGFDAAVEFAPQNCAKYFDNTNIDYNEYSKITNPLIIQYNNVMQYFKMNTCNYTRYRCVCPAWDNTARKGDKSPRIVIESSPELFKEFLHHAVVSSLVENNKFVFINAWNEWGEGTHLEPDNKYGYSYLQICKEELDLNLEPFK